MMVTVDAPTPKKVAGDENDMTREAGRPPSATTAPSASREALNEVSSLTTTGEAMRKPLRAPAQSAITMTAASTTATTIKRNATRRCDGRGAKGRQMARSGIGQTAAPVN